MWFEMGLPAAQYKRSQLNRVTTGQIDHKIATILDVDDFDAILATVSLAVNAE